MKKTIVFHGYFLENSKNFLNFTKKIITYLVNFQEVYEIFQEFASIFLSSFEFS